MANEKNVLLFTQQLTADRQAEGLAVHWAVMTGKCNQCDYLPRCCSDSSFKLPKDSFCIKKKEKILKRWNGD